MLRLATERLLSTDEIVAIGLFRQAIQSLRESIRDDVEPPIGSSLSRVQAAQSTSAGGRVFHLNSIPRIGHPLASGRKTNLRKS